jgi:hypothetical protein
MQNEANFLRFQSKNAHRPKNKPKSKPGGTFNRSLRVLVQNKPKCQIDFTRGQTPVQFTHGPSSSPDVEYPDSSGYIGRLCPENGAQESLAGNLVYTPSFF